MHLLIFLTDRFLDGEACLLLLNLVRGKFKMWGRRKRTRDLADRQTDTQTDRIIEEVGTLQTDRQTDIQTKREDRLMKLGPCRLAFGQAA